MCMNLRSFSWQLKTEYGLIKPDVNQVNTFWKANLSLLPEATCFCCLSCVTTAARLQLIFASEANQSASTSRAVNALQHIYFIVVLIQMSFWARFPIVTVTHFIFFISLPVLSKQLKVREWKKWQQQKSEQFVIWYLILYLPIADKF